MSATGAALFARFAYPPNLLGYCGPADTEALFAYGSGAVAADRGLDRLAREFEGAWPYLELLAGAAGTDDPLAARVVEAYWIGGDLLARVGTGDWGWHLRDRFRPRCGAGIAPITDAVGHGATPNHAFHVFGVYPWVGLLDSGRGEPLDILNRCRIRWAQVVACEGDRVVVWCRPLTWDGRRLGLGERELLTVTRAVDGLRLVDEPAPGEWVALHWDWLCDRLDRRQLANLQKYTRRQLEVTNSRVAHPGPAMVLG